ncbi:hypothetical protein Pan44_26740 [Caulifigura coniformis]|uniref:DUF2190 family protein n=1 Tax=Caulifigura coniformis TaxID=2527983 RepID=A0A517SEU1_9PLAN|nr:DUF2190 family protein [Caulifigura coniformis]QDT54639.1 hypothetical protein Pan44_26740 [Caulifigura coniformis]
MAEAQVLNGAWDEEIVTASGSYASGKIVKAPSNRAGYVAGLNAIDDGEKALIKTTGKVRVPSASATTFSVGAEVQWDNTNKLAVASGDFVLGPAIAAKTNGQTTVDVLLNGRPSVAADAVDT